MLLEKLCLQKWRKKKQNLNCILLPGPLISHQKANLSLLLFSHTRLSPQQKYHHTSNFHTLVLASLSDQQAGNLCQLECQSLDLPFDRPFHSSTGFWIWSITMEISYYQCWVVLKGCCTRSLRSDSFRVSFKTCPDDDDDDDFRFKKLVWFSGGKKERILQFFNKWSDSHEVLMVTTFDSRDLCVTITLHLPACVRKD